MRKKTFKQLSLEASDASSSKPIQPTNSFTSHLSAVRMAFFAPIMGAIAASEWFIPTIVTTAAVVIGQVAAVPGHIKPGYSTPDAHMVRVFLGMGDSRNGSDAAGVPPWIDLYDELGRHIGHDYTKKKPIPEGGFQDYVITPEQEHNNRRAAYIRLTAGKPAFLIRSSSFTVTNQI